MENVLIPVLVCVLLPIVIVWLVVSSRRHEMDKKTEVMLKAIESGTQIDPEFFKPKVKVNSKGGLKQDLLDKLTGACITTFMGIAFLAFGIADTYVPTLSRGLWFMEASPLAGAILLAVGIGLFISYFTGKRMLAKEIEAEEKELEK